MSPPAPRSLNPARQLLGLKAALKDVTVALRDGALRAEFTLQPTSASAVYRVRLVHRLRARPMVTILDPPLRRHEGAAALPHVYPGDELCLYYPGQWNDSLLLARTIVPWTSEWLLHYELWLITGRWEGGGHRHEVDTPGRRAS
jgi:hypothetical protein